ncbi:MAG: tripartite tricarboxylate transporter substrate binding protein, partial [Pseudomonadota bacterium]
MRKLLRCSALAFAVILASPGVASSQPYPTKPVRVVIPWPAGGSVDIVGRVVMQKVGESLGQQFV